MLTAFTCSEFEKVTSIINTSISVLTRKKNRDGIVLDKNRLDRLSLLEAKCKVSYPECLHGQHFVNGKTVLERRSIFLGGITLRLCTSQSTVLAPYLAFHGC